MNERILRVLKTFDFDAKFELKFDHDEWLACLITPGVTMFGRGDTPDLAVNQIIRVMDNWPAHFSQIENDNKT